MTRVLIGTSGWHYDSWRGPFFPKGLPIKNQLQYYASQFTTAELNGVFYRTPTGEAVRSWREQTNEQDGYERAPDTFGARLRPSPRRAPGPRVAAGKKLANDLPVSRGLRKIFITYRSRPLVARPSLRFAEARQENGQACLASPVPLTGSFRRRRGRACRPNRRWQQDSCGRRRPRMRAH
jgi:Protein of unknown function DUF72